MYLCCAPVRARFGVEEHYKLIRRLGYGGEGEVWLATPRAAAAGEPPRHVAIKLLRRGLSKWQVETVAAEVQCLLELGEGHVNIIKPTELLLSRTHLALVTDYAPGGSLSDYLRRRSGGLPEQEASYFFRQIVAALQFCHARGIVYRDVKPENTLLSGGSPPTVSLCDFGVARRFGARPEHMTTLVGTPGYFAPQVLGCMFGAREDAAYDGAKADVWSCGALLSELLLRRLPYDFDAFELSASPTGALRRLWERARSTPWRDAAARSGRPVQEPLSTAALDLLDGMLHPAERERMHLDDVAAHPWVRQPLSAPHEAALAELEARQVAVKRQARISGVYCRSDGDGIIAAIVSRASARSQAAAAADAEDDAPDCIRLRLEDVPRMQCPPSLAGVPPSASAPSASAPSPSPHRRGAAARPPLPGSRGGSPRLVRRLPFGGGGGGGGGSSMPSAAGAPPRTLTPPPMQQGCLAGRRSRTLAVAAVDDGDDGDDPNMLGYVYDGKLPQHGLAAPALQRTWRLVREEATV